MAHPILKSSKSKRGTVSVPFRLKVLGSLVSVRIGLKGRGIDDSLVVHQLVTLVIGKGEELVVFGVSDNLVAFDDLGLTRSLLRLLEFVQHVLTHDVIIQLGFAFAVQ